MIANGKVSFQVLGVAWGTVANYPAAPPPLLDGYKDQVQKVYISTKIFLHCIAYCLQAMANDASSVYEIYILMYRPRIHCYKKRWWFARKHSNEVLTTKTKLLLEQPLITTPVSIGFIKTDRIIKPLFVLPYASLRSAVSTYPVSHKVLCHFEGKS